MLTKEQLELRRTGIGGSDISAITGTSTYENATPFQIYLSKIGEIDEKEQELNDSMYWGNMHEETIAREYAIKTGVKLSEPTEMFRHPENAFMIANPDRLIKGQNGILECKTAGYLQRNKWGKEGTDQIPDAYYLQVAHYAYVCNVDYVDIAVLIGGNDYRIYRYNRKKKIENKLIEIERNFWEKHVIPRIPPPSLNLKDVQLKWPDAVRDSLKGARKEQLLLIDQLQQIKDQKLKLVTKEMSLKKQICDFLEEAEALLDDKHNYIATWKNVNQTSFNVGEFKKDHEDLYNQYLRKNVIRQLRIKYDGKE